MVGYYPLNQNSGMNGYSQVRYHKLIYAVFWKAITHKLIWSSGMTSRCGRASPGSIPGISKFLFAVFFCGERGNFKVRCFIFFVWVRAPSWDFGVVGSLCSLQGGSGG